MPHSARSLFPDSMCLTRAGLLFLLLFRSQLIRSLCRVLSRFRRLLALTASILPGLLSVFVAPPRCIHLLRVLSLLNYCRGTRAHQRHAHPSLLLEAFSDHLLFFVLYLYASDLLGACVCVFMSALLSLYLCVCIFFLCVPLNSTQSLLVGWLVAAPLIPFVAAFSGPRAKGRGATRNERKKTHMRFFDVLLTVFFFLPVLLLCYSPFSMCLFFFVGCFLRLPTAACTGRAPLSSSSTLSDLSHPGILFFLSEHIILCLPHRRLILSLLSTVCQSASLVR